MLENLLKKIAVVKQTDELVRMAAASQGALDFAGALVGRSEEEIFLLNEDGLWEVPISGVISAVEIPHNESERPFATENSISVRLQIKRRTIVTLKRQFEIGVDLVAKTDPRSKNCPSPDCNQCSNGGCCCPPKPTCLNVGCTD
jgi:hypothetical protein